MKLVVDIGNTLTKAAVFNRSDMVDMSSTPKLTPEIASGIFEKYPDISTGIVASVKKVDHTLIQFLRSKISLQLLDATTRLPFQNLYKSKESLGYDRIAAVAGGMQMYPDSHVLVINAGTCITYDLLTADHAYMGGGISPGIRMRFTALNAFTEKLPLIEADEGLPAELIGSDTGKSILSGVLNGVLAEVDGIIDQYKPKFSGLKIIVSGGDYKYFDKNLKNNIFATPNIVLKGLNSIHGFNEKE